MSTERSVVITAHIYLHVSHIYGVGEGVHYFMFIMYKMKYLHPWFHFDFISILPKDV